MWPFSLFKKKPKKSPAHPSLFPEIVKMVAEAPDSQISYPWRVLCRNFNGTPVAAYDLLAKISKLGPTEASSFVKTLCNVERYYERPKENG
jgi:hypothetical protein